MKRRHRLSALGPDFLINTISWAAPWAALFLGAGLMQLGDSFSEKADQTTFSHHQCIDETAKRLHNLGKIEADRHKVGVICGPKPLHRTKAGRVEGERAVSSRVSGALARAVLVVVVVAAPSVLLPDVSGDTKQMVALFALFAGAMTFAEYNAVYPSVTEFRDAPPYNRIRFVMLAATLFGLIMMERGHSAPSSLTLLFAALGNLIGTAMDFPYSPVRLATLMLSGEASAEQVMAVRDAAGVAYLVSLISLAVFVIMLRIGAWPLRDRPFNVWINLPTFDPTASIDVVERLERDGRINIAFGFLLPFITPFLISLGTQGLNPISLTSPQTLIWTMTAWAFLPASLFMRGIALGRIAELIRDIRRIKQENEHALAVA